MPHEFTLLLISSVMGEKRNAHRILWKSQREKVHLEDLEVCGRIMLIKFLGTKS
jgi:hypothetical protein